MERSQNWFYVCDTQARICDLCLWHTNLQSQKYFCAWHKPNSWFIFLEPTHYIPPPISSTRLDDALLPWHSPSLSCLSESKKQGGQEEALPLPEGHLEKSFYRGAPSTILENPSMCSDPAEAVSVVETACIAKWSSLYNHDGLRLRVLQQDSSEVCSYVFRAHAFWQVRDDYWDQGPTRAKERSSAQGLPWACISLDMHQGIIECVATCFWSYLY